LYIKARCLDELEIRLVQQANQCAISIRQAQLNRAVQAQVEELKLNQLKDDFQHSFSNGLNINYFMLTVNSLGQASPSLSTNLARRICAGN